MKFFPKLFLTYILFVTIAFAGDKNYPIDEENNLTDLYEKDHDIDTVVKKQKMFFEVETLNDIDWVIEDYMKDIFPIISDDAVDRIIETKKITEQENSDKEGASGGKYKINFDIPQNYLIDTAKIMWELNIPEFKSRIYQFYNGKELLIDTWPNVVGTASTKTYTGNFQAYRLRNYPFYKDPDPSKADLPATPPGKNNPLGLFVVHYDENSLRYFHGTNKNHLLKNTMRNLSHGCVRNDNDNIDKMKSFIIKRVVKADDLSGWLGSKKSMIYNLKQEDKFPVKIIYKTFNIDKDEKGSYIILFKDIYNYSNPNRIDTKWNDVSLITLSTRENIISEYKHIFGSNISDELLETVTDYVISNPDYYEKQYFDDLIKKFTFKH